MAKEQRGAALYLSILILSGIFLVAMSLADIVMTGIRMGGIQAQSTQAYFASEAGVEKVLWHYRQDNYNRALSSQPGTTIDDLFDRTLDNGSSYKVDYMVTEDEDWIYRRFYSEGDYRDVRRSVEVTLKYPHYYLDYFD